jgi:transposase
MMLRRRELLVKQRTMLINAMRGHAAEFGVVAAKGVAKVSDLLQRAHAARPCSAPMQRAHAEEAGVPALALDMLRLLASQLEALELKLKTIEARLMAWHKQDPVSQCLATQPGIGPIGAVSFALKVTDPKAFRSGRHFAAWLGADPEGTRPAVARGRAGSAGRAMKACAGSWCSAPPRWCSSPSRAGPRPG